MQLQEIRKAATEWLAKNATITSIVAVVVALGTLVLDFRKDDRFEYQDLLNEFRLEVMRLREVEASCNQAFLKHSKEISSLQNRLIMLESATMDSPFPMWLKSVGTKDKPGVMLVLNSAYERRFLLPLGRIAENYVGKTDAEFWGKEIGNQYWEIDKKVISTGLVIDTYEPSPITKEGRIRVVKYPRLFNRQIVGIAGIAIPSESVGN